MPSPEPDIFAVDLVAETVCDRYERRSPLEAEPTARLRQLPGRDQRAFEAASPLLVGAGAQGILAWALLRSGMRRLTICDPDFFDMTNLSRQLGYPEDLGKPKAHQVARNLRREAVNGARITSIALPFPEALEFVPAPPTLVACLVDDNACRAEVARWARRQRIPAVIAGLSHDGARCYVFLQAPGDDGACLGCAFPEFVLSRAPCVGASIKTVFLVAAHMLQMIDSALMGWPEDAEPHNLRLADLHARIEYARQVARQEGCWLCGS